MVKAKEIFQVPGGEKQILLHTCCAPCSSAIIDCLMKMEVRPVIYFCNPNIYPLEEYEIRKAECIRYAHALGLEVVDADYDHGDWLSHIKGLEDEPERGGRCLECFRYRLLRAAEYASGRGIKVISTTLASSRWKSLEQIGQAGQWACRKVCDSVQDEDRVLWWDVNWRKGGLQERRLQLIREYGFYNQLYCGCEFSFRTASKEDDR